MTEANEDHARNLWHSMWFQALQAGDGPTPISLTTPEDIETYGYTPEEVADMDAFEADRDPEAEYVTQVARCESYRYVMSLLGYDVPAQEDLYPYPTFDMWMEKR